jgi:hypothetical protein
MELDKTQLLNNSTATTAVNSTVEAFNAPGRAAPRLLLAPTLADELRSAMLLLSMFGSNGGRTAVARVDC